MKHLWALLFVGTIGFIDIYVQREEFILLMSLYTMAFLLYLYFLRSIEDHHNIIYFVFVGIAARLISIVGFPNLSDDIYRFYWDGDLLLHHMNPYLTLPSDLVNSNSVSDFMANQVYPFLNSQNYFTVYPPFSQFIYGLGVSIAHENLYLYNWVIGGLILLAECGTLYIALKLLPLLGFDQKNILIYALNPLIIIETTGNLHFEAILVFFFLMAVWTQHRKRWWRFGIFFTLSILTKLFTTVFYPLFLRRLGWNKFIWIGIGIVVGLAIGYAPFISEEMIQHVLSSLDLYVRKFEFNGSIYYILREIGYSIKGYNTIHILGPLLAVLFFITLGIFYALQYINDRGILLRSMFIFSVYLFLSPIVHPWYLVLLLSLSIFTKYRYPLVWTYLIFLSYSAYVSPEYKENMALLITEYAILFLAILVDFKIINPKFLPKLF